MKSNAAVTATAIAALYQPAAAKVNCGGCEDIDAQRNIDCATVKVPLDYTSPNRTETLDLQLLRVQSKHKPSKGSILFNFGGPGLAGRDTLSTGYNVYMAITGGQYDLVTFDPRGTGKTIPISCFESDEARDVAILGNPDVWHTVITQSALWDERSDTARGSFWATGDIVAEQCFAQHGETGTYVGTAFTARDIIKIVDALDEGGMLRYWGGSYGTTLGTTTAYMFPERIGKMVIDGVQSPAEYAYEYHERQISDTDKVFSHFFKACIDDPKYCPLARNGDSSSELEQKIWELLEDVKYNPISVNGTLYGYQNVKTGMMVGLYGPSSWPLMATGLDYLLNDNLTGFAEAWAPLSVSIIGNSNLNSMGIRCSDRFARITAKERYKGEFRANTKNPVLVIGNTGDLLTPLAAARNVTETLEGSVLLQHDAYGHSSVSHLSNCTINAVAKYYVDNTLPEPGTKCKPDVPPFEVAAKTAK